MTLCQIARLLHAICHPETRGREIETNCLDSGINYKQIKTGCAAVFTHSVRKVHCAKWTQPLRNDGFFTDVMLWTCIQRNWFISYHVIMLFSIGTNGIVTYGSIVGDDFSIHPVTGVITTTKALDREAQGVYAVTGTLHRKQLLNCTRESRICF